MRFKFIGDYTNRHSKINAWGLVFEGREPLDVPDHLADKFARHVEFEEVQDAVYGKTEAEAEAAPEAVKKRGRPKKVAE